MYQRNSFKNEYPTLGELDQAGIKIFNDWWSTYIPEHKETLIKKIMHTYYFEEIGSETPERFIFYINAHLERIMPYYNQLYASELIKVNPLLNHSIESSGRSIENILAKANSTDDKFSKAIREFAGIIDKSDSQVTDGNVSGASTKTDAGHDTYHKEGTEDITDNTEAKGSEDENTHEAKITDCKIDKTENEKTDNTTTTTTDKTVTENPGEVSTKEMQWGQTETGTEKVVGKDISDGTGTKDWSETKDDSATTHTVTNLKENSSGSSEKDFADTPQKKLEVVDDTSRLRKDYLTNVTWNSESSQHTADTTQDTTFKDDETREHRENTTDKNTTDKTQDTDTTRKKGGTDTETTTKSGQNVTKTDSLESTTLDGNRNANTDTTEHSTVNTDIVRDLDTTDTSKTTRDKDWTEDGSSDTNLTSTTTTNTDSKSNVNSTGTEQTKESADVSQSSVNTQNKTSEETTDKGSTNITSGFMNVSASALLEAFRKTFINVDEMIIKQLRENFMVIY